MDTESVSLSARTCTDPNSKSIDLAAVSIQRVSRMCVSNQLIIVINRPAPPPPTPKPHRPTPRLQLLASGVASQTNEPIVPIAKPEGDSMQGDVCAREIDYRIGSTIGALQIECTRSARSFVCARTPRTPCAVRAVLRFGRAN